MKKLPYFKFRLYVAGAGPYSSLAIVNLNAICAEHLRDRHEIEVVDVLIHQKRALAEGVIMTPLLVKVSPAPVVSLVGAMTLVEPVLQALGLQDSL